MGCTRKSTPNSTSIPDENCTLPTKPWPKRLRDENGEKTLEILQPLIKRRNPVRGSEIHRRSIQVPSTAITPCYSRHLPPLHSKHQNFPSYPPRIKMPQVGGCEPLLIKRFFGTCVARQTQKSLIERMGNMFRIIKLTMLLGAAGPFSVAVLKIRTAKKRKR
jgi:hypothetical protein